MKALEVGGWPVRVEDERTVAQIGPVPIALRIEQLMETVQRPPDPPREPPWKSTADYAFHDEQRVIVQRKPAGRLSIGIAPLERLPLHGHRRTWRESERSLEEQLHRVLVGMVRLALGVLGARAARERYEREAREREEQRQAALEEQRRLRASLAEEQARVERLRDQAARWRESEELRRFVEAARERGPQGELEGEALAEWIEWALRQADRLDSLTPSRCSPSVAPGAVRGAALDCARQARRSARGRAHTRLGPRTPLRVAMQRLSQPRAGAARGGRSGARASIPRARGRCR